MTGAEAEKAAYDRGGGGESRVCAGRRRGKPRMTGTEAGKAAYARKKIDIK